MNDNKKAGNLGSWRCLVLTLATSPRRMWQNRTEHRTETGQILSVFSNFLQLNPAVDAAANLHLQQAVQSLTCNSEAAATELSLAESLPKGTLEWMVCSSKRESRFSPSVQGETSCCLFIPLPERIAKGTEKGLWGTQSCYRPTFLQKSSQGCTHAEQLWEEFLICRVLPARSGVAITIVWSNVIPYNATYVLNT